jgi:predicted 3-demethylubiquinone-9 3-methyltransferase (glyoxalase superfamily)
MHSTFFMDGQEFMGIDSDVKQEFMFTLPSLPVNTGRSAEDIKNTA